MVNNETAVFAERGQVVIEHRDVMRRWIMSAAQARQIAAALMRLAATAEQQQTVDRN